MSDAPAPDPARLKELHRRFETAALDHPDVEAVVVYRPDLRREEAERQSLALFVTPADPASNNYHLERLAEVKGTYEAMRFALACREWIPPTGDSIEQLGFQGYGGYLLRIGASECPVLGGLPPDSERWECGLFGPPAPAAGNSVFCLFNALAQHAVNLVVPSGTAAGHFPLTRWLIHLVNEAELLGAGRRLRQYLSWPGPQAFPQWVPVTPMNTAHRPANWWAARLPGVFHLSALALGQAINAVERLRPEAVAPRSPAGTTVVDGPSLLKTFAVEALGNEGKLVDGTKPTVKELHRRLQSAGVDISRTGLYENDDYKEARSLCQRLGLFRKLPKKRRLAETVQRGSKDKNTGHVEAADHREKPPDHIAH
jgi:hypothetical protein